MANMEQDLKSVLELLRHLRCSFSTYYCFQEQNIKKQRLFNLICLTLFQNCFPFKEFQIIVVRIFHESSSNTKIAVEICFLGRICRFHYQAPVWPNTKRFPGSQLCKEPLNRFAGTCETECSGIDRFQVLQG